jgi:3-hydroxyisobutyrate dehydrogenase-like beta-hydroxyacid dehydrogenase
MTRIAMMHPGAMGAAVGAALTAVGHEVVWLPAGRSAATQRRAEAADLQPVDDMSGCELVMSVVPPGAARATAEAIAGFTGLVVDANAISPATAADVAAAIADGGGTYVDGGIIGPPPDQAGTTRLYLSGGAASEVAALFAGARIEARVLEAAETSASALKMSYASWTKISAALLLAARDAAAALGVEPALVAEWDLSQPQLADRWQAAHASAHSKGWRWTDEMREIARTFAAVDQPAEFGSAAALVYERFPRPDSD